MTLLPVQYSDFDRFASVFRAKVNPATAIRRCLNDVVGRDFNEHPSRLNDVPGFLLGFATPVAQPGDGREPVIDGDGVLCFVRTTDGGAFCHDAIECSAHGVLNVVGKVRGCCP